MKSGEDMVQDVNFLFEMGSIRYIDRMWRRFLNKDFANLSEHHFRVFWIAMVIAGHEKGVDTGKIAKMVMVHDIAESRAGDVDYISRQYVERNEKMGIEDILHGTSIEKEFYELWQEYEIRESLESKIVKDADNLDVDMELAEQAAQGKILKEQWVGLRTKNVKPRLFTETAKKLFDQINTTSPHDWHVNGRNRHSSGDWKSTSKEG